MGLLNLGFCIHVAADESHLHLQPAAVLRIFGAQTASIPWASIGIAKRGRRWMSAKINNRTLYGPAWCLGLAEPAAADQATPTADDAAPP